MTELLINGPQTGLLGLSYNIYISCMNPKLGYLSNQSISVLVNVFGLCMAF